MKLALSSNPVAADLCIVLLSKGENPAASLKTMLGKELTKQIDLRIKAHDFEGEEGQVLTLFGEKEKWKRLVLLGRGEKGKEGTQTLEHLGAKMIDIARMAKAESILIINEEKDLMALAYGVSLGAYQFKRYKTPDKKEKAIQSVNFFSAVNKNTKDLIEKMNVFMKTSIAARELINTCAGDLNPKSVADEAVALCKKNKMKVTVFNEKQLKKMGCGAIVAIGQGAQIGSRMVIMEYRNKSKAKEANIAFVGKGITFDTGGLNLKPTGYIEDMKLDMTGAATVMALMQGIAERKLKGYFVGVLCCAENAISDKAVHPGDVVTAYNGKTIEINNTDAEGRMVLADGLSYTNKNYKPKAMIDIATLTGAVTVALGYHITGVLGNEQKIIDEYLDCSKSTGERSWQLPLDEDFVKACKGRFSDLTNSPEGVRGGAIAGAAFLKHFVDDKTPWVHLDVAGSAWAEKPTPTSKYGATAVAIRSLLELAERHQG